MPRPFITVAVVNRARRALTLLEVTIVVFLVGIILVLVAGEISESSQPATARAAQTSVETTLDAMVSGRVVYGALTTDPAALVPFAPSINLVSSGTASNDPDTASIGIIGADTVVVAVHDGHDSCWVKVRRFSATGRTETHALTTLTCSADIAGGIASGTPPSGRGDAWNRPWIIN